MMNLTSVENNVKLAKIPDKILPEVGRIYQTDISYDITLFIVLPLYVCMLLKIARSFYTMIYVVIRLAKSKRRKIELKEHK